MPIFEYACQKCGNEFEALVLKATVVACPKCKSQTLEKLFSMPAVRSEGSHQRMLANSKKRDQRQAKEIDHAQKLYEASHDDG